MMKEQEKALESQSGEMLGRKKLVGEDRGGGEKEMPRRDGQERGEKVGADGRGRGASVGDGDVALPGCDCHECQERRQWTDRRNEEGFAEEYRVNELFSAVNTDVQEQNGKKRC